MWGNVLWWTGYLVAAVWLQRFFPGLDALIPAFLVCLQERNRQQLAVILLFSVLIQEGAGTFPFGLSLLWHGAVVALYCMGIWLFMSGGGVFMLLLSSSLGVSRGFFALLMDSLRHVPSDMWSIGRISALQAFFTLLLWTLAKRSRDGRSEDAHHH